mgnify:FL=1
MKTLVMKFGGTSVGSADAIRQAAAIVKEYAPQWERLTVVVSAMRGITDALIHSARAAARGDQSTYQGLIADLQVRHYEVIMELIPAGEERKSLLEIVNQHINELSAYCNSIHVLGEVTPRGMDTITSLGERLNARVVSAALRQIGLKSQPVNATELILTDTTFQSAVPDMEATRGRTRSKLIPIFDDGFVPVVTGFISATPEGIITTLGRGGSDYTAAILGACLDADEVWTWTDVDGVMTADPRIVSDARVIPELSFSEVSELAYFGAKVLHPKTIRPIIEQDIPLWVKNTFNPGYPGTRITAAPQNDSRRVTAISTIPNLSMVTVEGRGMLGVPGIAARTFSAVARTGASVLMISQASSEQSISFVIPTTNAPGVIASLETEMSLEITRRDIDRIWSKDDVTILTVVGAAIRNTPGVAARIFGALGKADINVIAIAQGSSEYSISLVLADADAQNAMRYIHAEMLAE